MSGLQQSRQYLDSKRKPPTFCCDVLSCQVQRSGASIKLQYRRFIQPKTQVSRQLKFNTKLALDKGEQNTGEVGLWPYNDSKLMMHLTPTPALLFFSYINSGLILFILLSPFLVCHIGVSLVYLYIFLWVPLNQSWLWPVSWTLTCNFLGSSPEVEGDNLLRDKFNNSI